MYQYAFSDFENTKFDKKLKRAEPLHIRKYEVSGTLKIIGVTQMVLYIYINCCMRKLFYSYTFFQRICHTQGMIRIDFCQVHY